jgi:hypothetical protein
LIDRRWQAARTAGGRRAGTKEGGSGAEPGQRTRRRQVARPCPAPPPPRPPARPCPHLQSSSTRRPCADSSDCALFQNPTSTGAAFLRSSPATWVLQRGSSRSDAPFTYITRLPPPSLTTAGLGGGAGEAPGCEAEPAAAARRAALGEDRGCRAASSAWPLASMCASQCACAHARRPAPAMARECASPYPHIAPPPAALLFPPPHPWP